MRPDPGGPMEAMVHLDRTRRALGDQLTAALREAITAGRLVPGARLPSSRDLAADLRVSRGVVVAAYEQLIAEGRLVARRGSGTVVAPTRRPAPALQPPPYGGGCGPVAPLRPGLPDLSAFPRAAWRRAYERALGAASDADLGSGDPTGPPRLRAQLAAHLGRVRATQLAPGDLVVTTSGAQAFGLLAQVLRAAGVAAVGVEDPGSPAVRDHLRALGLRPVPVPVDAAGLNVEALDRAGVPAVVVTPAHQFPTGAVLAPGRRAALVAWARRTGGLIVEDDHDAEFRYDRDPVGCLQGCAPELVAYVGSVSKVLAPALRLGWLAVPPNHRPAVRSARAAADLGGPVLDHLAFAELLASGGYEQHLRQARQAHRRRRDALVAALARHLPGARVWGAAAGLHLVVELPAGVDDVAVAARARADGLDPMPLSTTRLGSAGGPGLVLGYASHPAGLLAVAVRRLAALVSP